jgi:hypothetical protein
VKVHRVEAEIEEFNVEQLEAETTAPPAPKTTMNDVEVDVTKRTKVRNVVGTILATNTVTLKTKTANEFKTKISLRPEPTTDFSGDTDVGTNVGARVETLLNA